MVDLSSCYFCARAVDAPLDEYTIGPTANRSRTVVLCAPCRQKLDPLLEPFRATGQQQQSGTQTDAGGIVTEEPETVFDDDTTATANDSDSASGEDGETPKRTDASDAGSSAVDSPKHAFQESTGASTDAEEPATEDSTTATDEESASNPLVTGADDDSSTEDVPFEEPEPDSSPSENQTPVDERELDSPDESTTDSKTEDPLSAVSTSTYNRVIRLLQNREFPVVRDEFEELASNAYQMDRGECSTALDAAIHKDLLAEENGLLKRPD